MKILIVDDEPVIREGIRKRLDKYGYRYTELLEAGNGVEAGEILAHKQIDIAFVDVNMPLCNGLEFIEKYRNSGTHFIVVSGYDKFEYVKKALNLKVFTYLLKPIDRTEFVETLNEIYASKYAENMLDKIVHNIEQNYLNPDYSLTIAKEQLNCSDSYICRVLKNEMNIGFIDLVNKYRVENAKTMILKAKGRIKFKEVSEQSGFNSQQYFNVVFKKYTEMTPAQYLKAICNEKEPCKM